MRLPHVRLSQPVVLFFVGALVGSFFTLKFTGRSLNTEMTPQGDVLGESVRQEQGPAPQFSPPHTAETDEDGEFNNSSQAEQTETRTGSVTVARVIDGDTVLLADGTRVRYLGIDAPEMDSSGRMLCLAEAAKAANVSLVGGKEVMLRIDTSDTDRYGRVLRYVYVGDVFVNRTLVEQGLARAYAYPPDIKHQSEFKNAEIRAQDAQVGMWGSVCGTAEGSTYIPTGAQEGAALLPNACSIKGNISANGEKIYHLPGCRSYEKTVITVSAGERWYCTEQEAQAAGWRKALDCY